MIVVYVLWTPEWRTKTWSKVDLTLLVLYEFLSLTWRMNFIDTILKDSVWLFWKAPTNSDDMIILKNFLQFSCLMFSFSFLSQYLDVSDSICTHLKFDGSIVAWGQYSSLRWLIVLGIVGMLQGRWLWWVLPHRLCIWRPQQTQQKCDGRLPPIESLPLCQLGRPFLPFHANNSFN